MRMSGRTSSSFLTIARMMTSLLGPERNTPKKSRGTARFRMPSSGSDDKVSCVKKVRPIPHCDTRASDRFWSKVQRSRKSECWLWLAGADKYGRGYFAINNVMFIAPRVAYFLATGCDPLQLNVNHSCDTPRCCNPSHLWTGTQADGIHDMDAKRRRCCRKGQHNHNARLTRSNVKQIRASSESCVSLAARYGVSPVTISHIRTGRTWK